MNTKTLVIAAVVIAATASLALAPTLVTTAMADAGGVNHVECKHKGNDNPCEETHGQNFVITCKVKGEQKSGDDCPQP
jgi:Spy/CpxP family protein refolding chaperone